MRKCVELYEKELNCLRAEQENGTYKVCPRCGGKMPETFEPTMSLAAWMIRICPECSRHENGIASMNVYPELTNWYWFKAEGDYKDVEAEEAAKDIEGKIETIYGIIRAHDPVENSNVMKCHMIREVKGVANMTQNVDFVRRSRLVTLWFEVAGGKILYLYVEQVNGTFKHEFKTSIGPEGAEELDKG
ncbi:MAG: hypothetical protein J6Y20_07410 [Lachnospiraceae bacterium]|nr:hypothetical protein [Lachnospiraceae bacterium]